MSSGVPHNVFPRAATYNAAPVKPTAAVHSESYARSPFKGVSVLTTSEQMAFVKNTEVLKEKVRHLELKLKVLRTWKSTVNALRSKHLHDESVHYKHLLRRVVATVFFRSHRLKEHLLSVQKDLLGVVDAAAKDELVNVDQADVLALQSECEAFAKQAHNLRKSPEIRIQQIIQSLAGVANVLHTAVQEGQKSRHRLKSLADSFFNRCNSLMVEVQDRDEQLEAAHARIRELEQQVEDNETTFVVKKKREKREKRLKKKIEFLDDGDSEGAAGVGVPHNKNTTRGSVSEAVGHTFSNKHARPSSAHSVSSSTTQDTKYTRPNKPQRPRSAISSATTTTTTTSSSSRPPVAKGRKSIATIISGGKRGSPTKTSRPQSARVVRDSGKSKAPATETPSTRTALASHTRHEVARPSSARVVRSPSATPLHSWIKDLGDARSLRQEVEQAAARDSSSTAWRISRTKNGMVQPLRTRTRIKRQFKALRDSPYMHDASRLHGALPHQAKRRAQTERIKVLTETDDL